MGCVHSARSGGELSTPNDGAGPELRAKKLHELLAEKLEELILNGTYPPGESLPSAQALAAKYGVSQTVVRDAIRGLAAKGLVQARHGVGVFVTENANRGLMDSARLALLRGEATPREIWEVRRIFEVEIAALAAARRTEEDLENLRKIVADYKAAAGTEPWEKTFSFHVRFHLALIKAVHNRAFTILMEPITELLIVSAQREDPGESAMRTFQQHEHIFSLIEAGDVEGARQAMLEHFTHPWAWDVNPRPSRKRTDAEPSTP
jgi:GntR family transcriptional repressor for pyruvate dehydrogenase complex